MISGQVLLLRMRQGEIATRCISRLHPVHAAGPFAVERAFDATMRVTEIVWFIWARKATNLWDGAGDSWPPSRDMARDGYKNGYNPVTVLRCFVFNLL